MLLDGINYTMNTKKKTVTVKIEQKTYKYKHRDKEILKIQTYSKPMGGSQSKISITEVPGGEGKEYEAEEIFERQRPKPSKVD